MVVGLEDDQAEVVRRLVVKQTEQAHVMRAGATDTTFPAIDHVSIHAGHRLTTTVSHLAELQGHLFAAPAAPQPLQPQWLNYQETTPLGTNDGPIDGPMDDLGSTTGGCRATLDEEAL